MFPYAQEAFQIRQALNSMKLWIIFSIKPSEATQTSLKMNHMLPMNVSEKSQQTENIYIKMKVQKV